MPAEAELEWLSETIRIEAPLSAGIAPQPGSEAANDDAYLRPYGTLLTDLATFRLRSAWDHLQALEILLRYATPTAPFAPYSLARGALVSAANAYWLVAGDTDDRRRSALGIHAEDARRDQQFLEANFQERRHELNQVDAHAFETAIQQAKERTERIRTARSKLTADIPTKALPHEIDVVASAQPALVSTGLNANLSIAYMRLSGNIHALPWAAKRNRHRIEQLPDGTERYRHLADREELLLCGKAVAHIAITTRTRLETLGQPRVS